MSIEYQYNDIQKFPLLFFFAKYNKYKIVIQTPVIVRGNNESRECKIPLSGKESLCEKLLT